jgi:hypothetical protein
LKPPLTNYQLEHRSDLKLSLNRVVEPNKFKTAKPQIAKYNEQLLLPNQDRFTNIYISYAPYTRESLSQRLVVLKQTKLVAAPFNLTLEN